MEEPRRRRPNRTAAARREQAARAQARATQHLLAGFAALRGHRGSQPTVLGAMLDAMLARNLEKFPGIKVENIAPQFDRYKFPDGHSIYVF